MQSQLGSRQTNRSNISSVTSQARALYQHPSNDIFNHSFYEQKLGANQSYQSVQYVKRYLKQSNLCVIIEKIMGTVLNLQKLPHNPFNLMYRLAHHEAIYQNLRRHYNQSQQHNNFINHNLPDNGDFESSNTIEDKQDIFVSIRLKEKEVLVTERLSKYLNMSNLFVFAKLTHNKRQLQRIKGHCEKYNLKEVHLSIGGPILLNLRGNGGILDVPVKLPRQAAEKSIYCAEAMLTASIYVEMGRQFGKCFNDFVDFIMTDIRQSMGLKDEHHTVFFQKLQVINIDDIFSLLQFSRDQLINQALFVQKELLRSLERQNITIRTKNIYRLSRQLATVVGQEFITVYKEYVLLAEQDGLTSLVSNEPLRYIFKEVFFSDQIISMVLDSPDYNDKDLMLEFKKEMVFHLLYELKTQNMGYLVWEIFYYLVYQNKNTPQNLDFVKQLFHTLSYLLLSPIAFVHQLSHTLKCAKMLTLPSFPTMNENQAYQLIIQAERDITAFVQKGNYVYWELQIFYQAIKVLLSLVIEYKQLKISSINFIIDHALLMLSGVSTNFNHILLVLQGNITNYISGMCRLLGDSQNESKKVLTYDLFLKEKQLPKRVLKVQDEVKKIKKQLSLQESEVKKILLAKYTSRYGLYQKVYQFYWNIVVGKKVMFPLSSFLKLLMVNSTHCSYQNFKENYVKPKFKVQSSTLNGVPVYQLNNSEAIIAYFALHPNALQSEALKQYKNIFQLIEPFVIGRQESSQDLGFKYGSKKSMDVGSIGGRTIVSIKSIDLGDNSSEQSSSFSVCKVLLDLVLSRPFPSKQELYRHVLEWLNSIMMSLDREGMSVLGLFSYQENHYEPLAYDECLYSRILNEDNCLRFDYKKKIQLAEFSKFIDYNINQGKFIEIKFIYTVRDVTKVIKIGTNFHYRSANKPYSLFKMHYPNQRVFSNKKDVLSWCQIFQFKGSKEHATTSKDLLLSVKRLQDEEEVSIAEVLSDSDLGQKQRKSAEQGINKFKYYRQSPFYNVLRKVSQILDVLLAVVEYLKTDRRGRFDLSHLVQLYQLLKYFLMERCLLKDDYIYSQGVSVSMLNLMILLHEYFEKHPDNCGEERQLLQFERVGRKLWGLVKFAQISCTICIHHSLNKNMGQQY